MLVHIFGAKSFPSVAEYAPQKIAEDHSQDHSKDVLDAVCRDFYVDSTQVKRMSKELQRVLAKVGF